MIRVVSEWTKDASGQLVPAAFKESYVGRVLSTGERNSYHDSDFFAVVWDDKQSQPVSIDYATTRFPTYDNSATVDADEATVAKYAAYKQRLAAEAAARAAAKEAATPKVGRRVRVKAGRKLPVGVIDEVFWVGADKYSPGELRIGIKLDAGGGKEFIAAKNVEVIQA